LFALLWHPARRSIQYILLTRSLSIALARLESKRAYPRLPTNMLPLLSIRFQYGYAMFMKIIYLRSACILSLTVVWFREYDICGSSSWKMNSAWCA
jgi:hypothetical protein